MSGTIDTNTFVLLTGNVPQVTQEIEVIEKPGEDGFIRRDLGNRSPAFNVETLGAYDTKHSGEAAFQVFDGLKEVSAVTFVKDGLNYTTVGVNGVRYTVAVIDVTKDSLNKVACNTISPTNNWLLRCTWILKMVPI